MLNRRERQALGALFRRQAQAAPPVWTELCPVCGARVRLEGAEEAVWAAVQAAFRAAHGCFDGGVGRPVVPEAPEGTGGGA
jgi:hypothetical protein